MERPDTFNVCVRLHMDLFSNLSFFYTTILVTLRYRQTQVQDLINQHANPTSPMNTAPYRRAVFSALWLQITLVCCYLPHGIMSALLCHSEESAAASFKRHYTITLVFTNSTHTRLSISWWSGKFEKLSEKQSQIFWIFSENSEMHKSISQRPVGRRGATETYAPSHGVRKSVY